MARRTITTAADIQSNAVYYSNEYKHTRRTHEDWVRLYDADFSVLEDVEVRYIDSLANLKRIVSSASANDYIYAAYDLKKLNDDFYLVEKNEYTLAALESAARAILK